MGVKLLDASMVLVANQFNPTVVLNPDWVSDHLGLREQDYKEYGFTPAFAQAVTDQFAFLIVPERFQFSPRVPAEHQQELLVDKVGGFVQALPHTPYVALGLNYRYLFTPDNAEGRALSRKLFFVPGCPLHSEFDTEDALFGGYLSRDVLDCRMKLDIKPNLAKTPGLPGDGFHFVMEFNFHHDIKSGSTAVPQILSALGKWSDALALAGRTVDIFVKGDRQ